jgi:hypothetical protein
MGIERLFFELRMESLKISLLRAFLNALIFFLLLMMAFSILNLPMLYAFILGVLFLIINTYINYAGMTLKKIEDANPEVREMLRTAKDTQKDDNIMVKALHQEIYQKAKRIYSGNMVSYNTLIIKTVIIGGLIIGSIFTSTVTWNGINIPFSKLTLRSGSTSDLPPVTLDDVQLENSDEIYGDVSIAKLGNELIQLDVNPSMSELDMNKLKEEEGITLNRNTYPVDIGTPKGAGASGAKRPEESELVNAFYLKKINK